MHVPVMVVEMTMHVPMRMIVVVMHVTVGMMVVVMASSQVMEFGEFLEPP